MKDKAQGQQYLKPYEEEVVVKYLLQMSDLGQPIRIKFIPFIAFRVTCHRPTTDRPLKPDRHSLVRLCQSRDCQPSPGNDKSQPHGITCDLVFLESLAAWFGGARLAPHAGELLPARLAPN